MTLKKKGFTTLDMATYFRPSFQKETEKEFQEFINNHPELPIRDPKELMIFATRKLIFEVEKEDELKDIDFDKLNEIGKMLREG